STGFTSGPTDLVNGDIVTSVTLTSTGASASATYVSPGPSYDIIPTNASGSGLGNYDVHYGNGTLTLSQRSLTVTAVNQSKTYGDAFTFDGSEFTASGLVNSDAVDSVTLTSAGAAATATVAGSPYDITASAATGTGLANYAI